MKILSLRGIDEEMEKALRKEAKRTKTSINTSILNLMRESLGLRKKKRNRVYQDLDELAGTWSEKDEQIFSENTQFFDKIDKEIWN
jgi:hypothetical protein